MHVLSDVEFEDALADPFLGDLELEDRVIAGDVDIVFDAALTVSDSCPVGHETLGEDDCISAVP